MVRKKKYRAPKIIPESAFSDLSFKNLLPSLEESKHTEAKEDLDAESSDLVKSVRVTEEKLDAESWAQMEAKLEPFPLRVVYTPIHLSSNTTEYTCIHVYISRDSWFGIIY